MKTPITDHEIVRILQNGQSESRLRIVCRKLELDRAELMKVLDWLDRWLGDKPTTECSKRITDALTAARANFPKS